MSEAAYRRKLYASRKEVRVKVSEKTMARKAKHRALIDSLKSVPCMDCRQVFPPCCMDFDHKPNSGKVAAVGAMLACSIDKILAEIAKCEVVCSNCHRIRTQQRRNKR